MLCVQRILGPIDLTRGPRLMCDRMTGALKMSNLLILGSVPSANHTSRIDAPHRQGLFPTLPINPSAVIQAWIARSRQWRALGELAERNDYLLKDIGVSQDEAWREAAKPFWQR
jgi:uncharacterized protein YjiS (DUF1127 family)